MSRAGTNYEIDPSGGIVAAKLPNGAMLPFPPTPSASSSCCTSLPAIRVPTNDHAPADPDFQLHGFQPIRRVIYGDPRPILVPNGNAAVRRVELQRMYPASRFPAS